MIESTHAVRWFKNGDHPNDRVGEQMYDPMTGAPYTRLEGAVVRYFRNPDIPGDTECPTCARPMHDHGWLDVGEEGYVVCPGDLIRTEVGQCGRRVAWPDGTEMARSCTCQIREHVILASTTCPHHGVHKFDREQRAVKLAHRMRAAFREAGGVMAHSATVPVKVMESWDAELDALDLSEPY